MPFAGEIYSPPLRKGAGGIFKIMMITEKLNQIDSQSVSSIEKTFQKATYLQLLSDTKEGVELYWLSNAFLPKNITGLSEKDGVMVCKLKLRYLKYLENF